MIWWLASHMKPDQSRWVWSMRNIFAFGLNTVLIVCHRLWRLRRLKNVNENLAVQTLPKYLKTFLNQEENYWTYCQHEKKRPFSPFHTKRWRLTKLNFKIKAFQTFSVQFLQTCWNDLYIRYLANMISCTHVVRSNSLNWKPKYWQTRTWEVRSQPHWFASLFKEVKQAPIDFYSHWSLLSDGISQLSVSCCFRKKGTEIFFQKCRKGCIIWTK